MTHTLLYEIEAFLKAHGMDDYRFGFEAVRNGRLVDRLRDGRDILTSTEERVRTFMREYERAREAAE